MWLFGGIEAFSGFLVWHFSDQRYSDDNQQSSDTKRPLQQA